MTRQRRRYGRWSAAILSGILCFVGAFGLGSTAEAALKAKTLVPVGHTVGIKLFSEGVVVVGLAEVEGPKGMETPGAACGLKVGDVIEEANGQDVHSTEQFSALLQGGGQVDLSVSRDGQDLRLKAKPVMGVDGTYRLGAWIRDSMAGIGTVTFYDPETGVFGALGHGITDVDTGLLMPLGEGAVMGSTVKAVKRGSSGTPGELRGSFDLSHDLGSLSVNTERGIFGRLEPGKLTEGTAVPVAEPGEIHVGPAQILSNVEGDTVETYDIEIVKISKDTPTQNLLLRVRDPRLTANTGGIVQGMSGSPIIQDGKLVGAVTHVLISDPQKGYGILIENMLDAAV